MRLDLGGRCVSEKECVCGWVPILSTLCHGTLFNKCKSTFQFSKEAKYSHGPPKNGFKGDRNM
jgi:hypothetical protein